MGSACPVQFDLDLPHTDNPSMRIWETLKPVLPAVSSTGRVAFERSGHLVTLDLRKASKADLAPDAGPAARSR